MKALITPPVNGAATSDALCALVYASPWTGSGSFSNFTFAILCPRLIYNAFYPLMTEDQEL